MDFWSREMKKELVLSTPHIALVLQYLQGTVHVLRGHKKRRKAHWDILTYQTRQNIHFDYTLSWQGNERKDTHLLRSGVQNSPTLWKGIWQSLARLHVHILLTQQHCLLKQRTGNNANTHLQKIGWINCGTTTEDKDPKYCKMNLEHFQWLYCQWWYYNY